MLLFKRYIWSSEPYTMRRGGSVFWRDVGRGASVASMGSLSWRRQGQSPWQKWSPKTSIKSLRCWSRCHYYGDSKTYHHGKDGHPSHLWSVQDHTQISFTSKRKYTLTQTDQLFENSAALVREGFPKCVCDIVVMLVSCSKVSKMLFFTETPSVWT